MKVSGVTWITERPERMKKERVSLINSLYFTVHVTYESLYHNILITVIEKNTLKQWTMSLLILTSTQATLVIHFMNINSGIINWWTNMSAHARTETIFAFNPFFLDVRQRHQNILMKTKKKRRALCPLPVSDDQVFMGYF